MFYCPGCGAERGWPQTLHISYGKCEICRKIVDCYECAASLLPTPTLDAEPDEHQEALKRLRNWARGLK